MGWLWGNAVETSATLPSAPSAQTRFAVEIQPPNPPDDMVQQYFQQVGAAGFLGEKSKKMLSKGADMEKELVGEFKQGAQKMKKMWAEFESFLNKVPEEDLVSNANSKEEGWELRIQKCWKGKTKDSFTIHGLWPLWEEKYSWTKKGAKWAGPEGEGFFKIAPQKGSQVIQEQLDVLKEEQGFNNPETEVHAGHMKREGKPCKGTKFDIRQLEPLAADMRQKWLSCPERGSKNREFWKHEWQKHGTCSGMTQLAYFKKGIELFDQYAKECNDDSDECRICFNRALTKKEKCPRDEEAETAANGPPSPSSPSKPKKGFFARMMESVGSQLLASDKAEHQAAQPPSEDDSPPTPPWAHDPAASKSVRQTEDLVERAIIAADEASAAATMAAASAEDSAGFVERAEEWMSSKTKGLHQAWETGSQSVTPQFIASLEDVTPPTLKTPYSGADGQDGSNMRCHEVCLQPLPPKPKKLPVRSGSHARSGTRIQAGEPADASSRRSHKRWW